MSKAIFQRKETKYMLTRSQYAELLLVMEDRMIMDKYGVQTVNNLYLDNEHFELISYSIQKPVYKEKVRIRVYGKPEDQSMCFLELKKKYKGIVYKRRIQTTLKKAEKYFTDGALIEDNQIMREIDYVVKSRNLTPKVYLAYDRVAYYGAEDPEFRMTFDTGIRYRWNDGNIRKQDEVEYLMDEDEVLLETKCLLAYPEWLIDFLNKNHLFKISYSKYGNIYKKMLQRKKGE